MKKDTSGAGTKTWGKSALPDAPPATTPESIAYEENQRTVLALAAEARQLLAQAPAPEQEPRSVSNLSAIEQKRADVDQALADAAERVRIAEENLKAADQAEVLAKPQREADRTRLLAERDRVQQEASALQSQLQSLEAIGLAETAAREQAGRTPEPLGAAEWLAQLHDDMEPMVSQAVSTLVKLKGLLADKGSTLETIGATTPPDRLPLELWRQRNAIADAAVRLRRELVDKIKEVQLALDRAASFSPERLSHETENQAHSIQLALENASGVVIHSRAFRDPGLFKIVTRELPAVPVLVTHYAEKMDSLLAAYLTIQQRVNAATKTAPREVIITVSSPAFERRRREKVGEMVRGRPAPEPPGPLADLGINTNEAPRV